MSSKVSRPSSFKRTIAICYIRLSKGRVKEESDSNSPDRQKANIEAVCKRHGWIPEWHSDIIGHRSGRSEKNRPGWLAAKSRLGDPDVGALVANDFARVHRKSARISDLLDTCDELGLRLVQAAPGRDFDTSTPNGRMLVQFIALQDESYANDVSIRQKDNCRYVNDQGKVNGIAPFGTCRQADGFLVRDTRGVWWLPTGQWVAGEKAAPPHPDARWRPYDRCALRILILYTSNRYGYQKTAARLNRDGWAFRDRWGNPRALTYEDVRRVLANWPEYGGAILHKKGKDKRSKDRSPHRYAIQEVKFYPQRAVFPPKLLIKAAQARLARSVRNPDHGVVRKAHAYALNEITFCAECAKRAREHNNLKLRSRLAGSQQGKVPRYRHKSFIHCGCTNRSVPCVAYEQDFQRLVGLLTVTPADMQHLQEATLLEQGSSTRAENEAVERQKQETLALCQRRIEAAVHLYGEGRIDRAEYLQRIEQNEREMADWESRTNATDQVLRELQLCQEAFQTLAATWESGTDEEKQRLVRVLFAEVLYDLDSRRINDFTLKPWAERYLMLRASLYETAGKGRMEPNDRINSTFQGVVQEVTPQGFGDVLRSSLESCVTVGIHGT